MTANDNIFFLGWTHMIEEIGLDEFVKRCKKEIENTNGLLTEPAAAYLVWTNWKSTVIKHKKRLT